MTISKLIISYPDFKEGTFMNPEEFDKNNDDIKRKVDEVIGKTNELDTKVKALGADQSVLWKGEVYMHADQTITPSKKLSECRTGWMLIWSDYERDKLESMDTDFVFTFIPKIFPVLHHNAWSLFPIPGGLSASTSTIVNKFLRIQDSTLQGHANNALATNGTADVVLRYVIEI